MDSTSEEEKRIEILERYRTLVESLSVGIYRNTPGPEGHFLEVNSALVAMLDAGSGEELMKHNVSDFYQSPKERAFISEKILKQGFLRDEELNLVTLKGRKIIASASVAVGKEKDGTIYFYGMIEDITERKKNEAALKGARQELNVKDEAYVKNLEKYKNLVNNLPVGVYQVTFGNEGYFLDANPTMITMLEASSKEEFMKHHVNDIIPDLVQRSFLEEKIRKQGFVQNEILGFVTLKGKRILASISGSLQKMEDGTDYFEGIIEDITERRRLEETLKGYEEERFKIIFDNTSDGMALAVADGEHKLSLANVAFCQMFGYAPEEIQRLSVLDLHPKENALAIHKQFGQQMRREITIARDVQVKKKDGSLFYADISASPIIFDGKKYMLGVFRDVTDRRNAEIEREQYFKFFNISSDMMIMLDADPSARFKKVNPAGRQMLGYSEEELKSKPFVEFIYPEDKQRTIDEVAKQLEVGSSLNFENRYICKDGNLIWISWRASYDKGERLIYATGRDITDRKEAEKREEEYVAGIESMNKLMVGRELKMVELKEEIEELKRKGASSLS